MEGMFRRTPEGVLLSVNPALARIHGYASPEEMMADVVDTSKKGLWVSPEERARYMELLESKGAVRGSSTRASRARKWIFWKSPFPWQGCRRKSAKSSTGR